MSINWVMLSDSEGFIPLANERRLHTCPPRISMSLQSLNKYPGREPFTSTSSSGRLFLTNRRIVYLPDSRTAQLQSFAAPLLNLHDTHVTAPFFGPNVWVAVCQPVSNGGIPSHHPAVELKLTFRDGGAYDFHNKFLQLRERLHQAVDIARENGGAPQRRNGDPANNVPIDSVHLEQLPAYEESAPSGNHVASQAQSAPATSDTTSTPQSENRQISQPPAEPPPNYEETQRDSVAESFEQSLHLRDTR